MDSERRPPGRRAIRLSRRQSEVVEWAAIGKTDWEISQILGISERVVKFHFEQARQKLNAANRTHAVAKAISLGLITLPRGGR